MKLLNLPVYGALLALVFLLTLLFEARLLPYLKKKRAAQPILEIGPSWHLKKSGTPTMGGLAFVGSITLSLAVFLAVLAVRGAEDFWQAPTALLGFSLAVAAIGFYDDCCKLKRKQNKGLGAAQKYFLQLLASGVFLFVLVEGDFVTTAVLLPFSGGELELGFFYYPLALLYLTGLINALNLTDGVDGLLGGTVSVTAAFFLLIGFRAGEGMLVLFGVLLLGGALGFLIFNAHPAKIFMGDTGSLFLGAVVAGTGLLAARPISVLIVGGVYLIEAASVILQVVYFKISGGKRLFLMAPLHHHFEKKGFGENKIVAIFSLATAALGVVAYWGC